MGVITCFWRHKLHVGGGFLEIGALFDVILPRDPAVAVNDRDAPLLAKKRVGEGHVDVPEGREMSASPTSTRFSSPEGFLVQRRATRVTASFRPANADMG